MKSFLIVVAGVVVGLLVFAALVLLWLGRKIRGVGDALRSIACAGGVPPFRITLEPAGAARWTDAAGLDLISGHFAFAGYHSVGDFEIPEMDEVTLRGFFHPGAGSYAVICQWGEEDLYAEVVQDFVDGTTLTVSSAPETGMDRPDHATLVRLKADLRNPATAVQLHERLLAESRGRSPVPARAEDFAHVFVEAYAQEADWRIARGGVTAEEVRRAAAARGMEEPDAPTIEILRSVWRDAIDAFIDDEVRKAWLAESNMTACEWEARRERIAVIHEHSDREEKIEELACTMVSGSAPEEDCEAVDRAFEAARTRLQAIFYSSDVREAFARAQALLPEKHRYERIARVEAPWPADLYLLPEPREPV